MDSKSRTNPAFAILDAMQESRVRALNTKHIGTGPVVYWMSRDCRVEDNWALLRAQERARTLKQPLIVVYNLAAGYLGGGMRQWDFKVRGLQEVSEKLALYNIPFYLIEGEPKKQGALLKDFFVEHAVGLIVTDFSPVRVMQEWVDVVAAHMHCLVEQVDAHNVIPCWVTSDKREFGAYTIRPKIHRLIADFLEDFPSVHKQTISYSKKVPDIDWEKILSDTRVNQQPSVVDWCTPGEEAARSALDEFIAGRLPHYATDRNDPTKDAQSNLSPYLHYGHIAPARVALNVWKDSGVSDITALMESHKNAAKNSSNNHAAFLEELIVRRELADNFCFYTKEYDTPACFPDWAQKTHAKHAKDTREYLYNRELFEKAKTHDDLWNAAQMEMVKSGKMHGYMRMYWAKKILEWTPDVATAQEIAIYLNDTYELDGRDPNGYAGIAWSLGGVHDRAWFERPIFGQIRYMNRNGCKAKFDIDAYMARWNPKETLFG